LKPGNLLAQCKLLTFERVQVLYSWKHSGFNVHAGQIVPPEAKADLKDLAQYILRNPFSVEKMTLESPANTVIYRSRLNAKINRNFEVFTASDFLAAITQHIPDKGAQMVRYYGWYSNKMRGVRHRGLPPELVVRRPGLSPPPPLKLPSKRWRDLILRSFIIHHSSFILSATPHPGLRECADRLSAAGSRPLAKPKDFARRRALGGPAGNSQPHFCEGSGPGCQFRPRRRQNGQKAGSIYRLTGACRAGIIPS
jgi:hypothetical protein